MQSTLGHLAEPTRPPAARTRLDDGVRNFTVLGTMLADDLRRREEAAQAERIPGSQRMLLPLALALARIAARHDVAIALEASH